MSLSKIKKDDSGFVWVGGWVAGWLGGWVGGWAVARPIGPPLKGYPSFHANACPCALGISCSISLFPIPVAQWRLFFLVWKGSPLISTNQQGCPFSHFHWASEQLSFCLSISPAPVKSYLGLGALLGLSERWTPFEYLSGAGDASCCEGDIQICTYVIALLCFGDGWLASATHLTWLEDLWTLSHLLPREAFHEYGIPGGTLLRGRQRSRREAMTSTWSTKVGPQNNHV